MTALTPDAPHCITLPAQRSRVFQVEVYYSPGPLGSHLSASVLEGPTSFCYSCAPEETLAQAVPRILGHPAPGAAFYYQKKWPEWRYLGLQDSAFLALAGYAQSPLPPYRVSLVVPRTWPGERAWVEGLLSQGSLKSQIRVLVDTAQRYLEQDNLQDLEWLLDTYRTSHLSRTQRGNLPRSAPAPVYETTPELFYLIFLVATRKPALPPAFVARTLNLMDASLAPLMDQSDVAHMGQSLVDRGYFSDSPGNTLAEFAARWSSHPERLLEMIAAKDD